MAGPPSNGSEFAFPSLDAQFIPIASGRSATMADFAEGGFDVFAEGEVFAEVGSTLSLTEGIWWVHVMLGYEPDQLHFIAVSAAGGSAPPPPIVSPNPPQPPVPPTITPEVPPSVGHHGIGFPTIIQLTIGNSVYSVNGVQHAADVAPFIADGRTMVPLRLISEAFDAEVDWDGATRTVSVTRGSMSFSLMLDVPLPNNMGTPVLQEGRTFVPVAFVAESLGATVNWDGATQTVTITQ
jgi:hypothetical protein